jgi:hypothetical protein
MCASVGPEDITNRLVFEKKFALETTSCIEKDVTYLNRICCSAKAKFHMCVERSRGTIYIYLGLKILRN